MSSNPTTMSKHIFSLCIFACFSFSEFAFLAFATSVNEREAASDDTGQWTWHLSQFGDT